MCASETHDSGLRQPGCLAQEVAGHACRTDHSVSRTDCADLLFTDDAGVSALRSVFEYHDGGMSIFNLKINVSGQNRYTKTHPNI